MSLPELDKLTQAQRNIIQTYTSLNLAITPEIEAEILRLSPRTKKLAPDLEAKEREADLILRSLEMVKAPLTKKCRECGKQFGTNYHSVGYCSNFCRAEAQAKIGIKWDWTKSDHDRYFYCRLPEVIEPETLYKLRQWAYEILAIEPEQNERVWIYGGGNAAGRNGIGVLNENLEQSSSDGDTSILHQPEEFEPGSTGRAELEIGEGLRDQLTRSQRIDSTPELPEKTPPALDLAMFVEF